MNPRFCEMNPAKSVMKLVRWTGTVCSISGEPQRPFRFTQIESHCEVLPVVKDDGLFAFGHRQQFLDMIEVHDGAAADAQKFLRVELRLQRAQRPAQDMTFLPELHGDVVAGGFDGVNVASLEDHDFVAGLNSETLFSCVLSPDAHEHVAWLP